eukprot:6200253-Pleurochrysis_carterae.AAC.2
MAIEVLVAAASAAFATADDQPHTCVHRMRRVPHRRSRLSILTRSASAAASRTPRRCGPARAEPPSLQSDRTSEAAVRFSCVLLVPCE